MLTLLHLRQSFNSPSVWQIKILNLWGVKVVAEQMIPHFQKTFEFNQRQNIHTRISMCQLLWIKMMKIEHNKKYF